MADNQHTTQVTETSDGAVHLTRTKGKKHQHITIHLEPDDLVRGQVGGFTNFLREYAVVGLAIGFIVGQQANAVVKQLVVSFVDPGVQILFGKNLDHWYSTFHHGTTPVKLPWGTFIYVLIEFFFVVIAIYIVVKLFRLDKLKKTDEEDKKKGKRKK